MVKQGDIIKIDFDPVKGREQGGFRRAVVISNNLLISKTNIISLCPITSKSNKRTTFDVPLGDTTETQGVVLCAHAKAVDLSARKYSIAESLPDDVLEEVLDVVISLIEKSE
jgi:mRNA interferase MazF